MDEILLPSCMPAPSLDLGNVRDLGPGYLGTLMSVERKLRAGGWQLTRTDVLDTQEADHLPFRALCRASRTAGTAVSLTER
jgi:hypothetical protein